MADLLPPNASAAERALSETLARTDLIGTPLRALWDPDTCPEAFLPWMAWMLSVDQWDRAWPATTKRAVIRESLAVHRTKGSRGSIERALAALGFPDASIVEGTGADKYDGTAVHDGATTYGFDLHWAEYQVFLPRPISLGQADLVRAALATVAPVRAHLVALNFEEPQALYDGAILHDGTYSYGVA